MSAAEWVGDLIRWAGAETMPERPSATIRRSHSLGDAESILDELAVSGNHGAGAALLFCSAAGLKGTAVKGMQVQVGAATYTVTADAVANSGSVALPITPILAATASSGAAVTVTRPYGETTWHVFRPTLESVEDANSERVVDAAKFHLAISPENQGVEIAPGSLFIFDRTRRVERATLVGGSRWELVVGEAA